MSIKPDPTHNVYETELVKNFLKYVNDSFSCDDSPSKELIEQKIITDFYSPDINEYYFSCESVYDEETDSFKLNLTYENRYERSVDISYKMRSNIPFPALDPEWHGVEDFTQLFEYYEDSDKYMLNSNIEDLGHVIIVFDNYENIVRFRDKKEIKDFIKTYKIGIMKFKIYLFSM